MITKRPYVLSIAGFDPSAGAGVLADVKTMEQCGVYGFAVNTASTFQNEDQFDGVSWVSFEDIKKQLDPLFRKYEIGVVKIGLIESLEVLEKVIAYLLAYNSTVKIIWDPILSASAGFDFHSVIDQEVLSKVLKNIYLITPNKPEYDLLNQVKESRVLLKGGHSEVKDDVLILQKKTGEERIVIEGSTNKMSPKHGSGCVLSSAITSYIALGDELPLACIKGKQYVEKILESNEGLLAYHKS